MWINLKILSSGCYKTYVWHVTNSKHCQIDQVRYWSNMEPVELDKALQPAVATAIGSIGLSPFINFKDACNHELDFLKHIDSSRDKYYDADYVDISIRRYEKYWLPLLAELTTSTEDKTETTSNRKSEGGKFKYAPPIDIHWVWHVHMLAPVSYIKDCKVSNG